MVFFCPALYVGTKLTSHSMSASCGASAVTHCGKAPLEKQGDVVKQHFEARSASLHALRQSTARETERCGEAVLWGEDTYEIIHFLCVICK